MSKHILLVDDDKSILIGLQTLLEEEGYRVTALSDCKKIDEELQKHRKEAQLILLDIFIKDQYGVDIAKKLKENQETKDIPIIMISSSPKVEILAREAQADGYIPKPIELSSFLQTVRAY